MGRYNEARARSHDWYVSRRSDLTSKIIEHTRFGLFFMGKELFIDVHFYMFDLAEK